MWSDEELDRAFQRLDLPPSPPPFPLDGWLHLENQLDADATAALVRQGVRQRVWRIVGAEVAVLLLAVLGWLLWPVAEARRPAIARTTPTAGNPARISARRLAPSGRPVVQMQPVAASVPAIGQQTAAPASPQTAYLTSPGADGQTLAAGQQEPAAQAGASGKHPQELAKLPLALTANGAVSAQSVAPTTRRFRAETADALAYQASRPALPYQADGTDLQRPGRVRLSRSAAPDRATARPALAVAAIAVVHPAPLNPAPNPSPEASSRAANEPVATPNEVAELSAAPVALRLPTAPAPPAYLAELGSLPAVVVPVVPRQPRLFVGLLVAPDVSTVRFASVQAPRPNVALSLEYRFLPRWRLSTGLQRANRQYTARKGDYDWSKYPIYIQNGAFEWVNGACTILDVPLNLRYDAWVRPHHRLFASAGLSTFFLPKENYDYNYLDNKNQPAVWERSYANQNRCLFGILNLSVGYERQLGQHWSLQAEPYVKLPLAGVGEGNVRLTSGGVFFGLKYGL